MSESDAPLLVLKGLEGNDPVSLNALQLLVQPYVPALVVMLWAVWSMVLVLILLKYLVGLDVFEALRSKLFPER
jgi:hypothetical protein